MRVKAIRLFVSKQCTTLMPYAQIRVGDFPQSVLL